MPFNDGLSAPFAPVDLGAQWATDGWSAPLTEAQIEALPDDADLLVQWAGGHHYAYRLPLMRIYGRVAVRTHDPHTVTNIGAAPGTAVRTLAPTRRLYLLSSDAFRLTDSDGLLLRSNQDAPQ